MIKHSEKAPAAESLPPETVGGGEVRECCLTLLRGLSWPGSRSSRPLRSVGVTSCRGGEGVSTVAAQLALTAASIGTERVLLVDGNLGRPSVQRTFRVDLEPGLAEVLLGRCQLEEGIHASASANLSILPAGRANGDSSRAYDAADVTELVELLKTEFELIVFDLPAAGQASSAIRLARFLDGVLLVVEAEQVRWEVAQRTKELLTRADAHLLGAVLNKRRRHIPNWLYRRL